MMIHSKFNGYKAGRRTYFGGGGGGGGASADATGDDGIGGGMLGNMGSMSADATGDDGIGMGMMGNPSDGLAGLAGGFYGANDVASQYLSGQYTPGAAANSPAQNQYAPQDQSSVNADIYRPTYTDYATGPANAVSSYGQNMQSPFGAFVDPFSKGGSQGIAGLYNQPEYADYGLAGLNR